MGEMADHYIQQMQDGYGWNPHSSRGAYGPPVACNRCGAKDVFWQKTRGQFVLHDRADLAPHTCPTTADGFDDEPI